MTDAKRNTWPWIKLRRARIAIARANQEPCCRCGGDIDYTLKGNTRYGPTCDHLHPLAHGGELLPPMELLAPAHMICNAKHGGRMNKRRPNIPTGNANPFLPPRKASPIRPQGESPPDKPDSAGKSVIPVNPPEVFADSPWMARIVAQMGADDVWPRVMTAPHPRAVGTYGYEAVERVEARRLADPQIPAHEKPLRWFQRLMFVRAYEHDEAGRLVWDIVVWTSNRQVGKSVGLREFSLDRFHMADRLGEEQLVLHIARDLSVAEEVQMPCRVWARELRAGGDARFKAIDTNGKAEVRAPGGRWVARAEKGAYGWSSSFSLVDECWDVSLKTVANGISKTQAARREPQLWLISTAHEDCTDLMPHYRNLALGELHSPDRRLIVEWSAPAGTDRWDEGGWRAASPFFDAARRRLIMLDVDEPSFDEQWLNIWPDRDEAVPLAVDPGVWAAAARAGVVPRRDRSVVGVSMEPAPDGSRRWPVVLAGRAEGDSAVVAVRLVGVFASLDEATAAAQEVAGAGSWMVAPAFPLKAQVQVRRAKEFWLSDTELAAAVEMCRVRLAAGELVHDPADTGLAEAVLAVPVRLPLRSCPAGVLAMAAAAFAFRARERSAVA